MDWPIEASLVWSDAPPSPLMPAGRSANAQYQLELVGDRTLLLALSGLFRGIGASSPPPLALDDEAQVVMFLSSETWISPMHLWSLHASRNLILHADIDVAADRAGV